ncbi:MAG: Maf family protein [Pseudomonadota bacterium]
MTPHNETAGPPLVLASSSAPRRMILENAGLTFVTEPARVDEEQVRDSLEAEGASTPQMAETLAELKAQKVSRRHPGALVIGADQMLDCEGRRFDKPRDMAEAKRHLQALSGKRHSLISAACVVRDGGRIWHSTTRAELTVRPLGDAFIEAYLAAIGQKALDSVGVYQLEGLGAQLFSRIEGDYFTILGLPLLPLLDLLRAHRVIGT